MARKAKVAVLYGGCGQEHDISRASAAAVLRHLDRDRFDPVGIYVTRTGQWLVDGQPLPGTVDCALGGLTHAQNVLRSCDVAFPVMHGRCGGDGTVQALLELIGVPYVGSGVLSTAAALDKEVTRRLLAAAGLTVTDTVVLGERDHLSEADRDRLGLPSFVKPARGGCGIGVSRVTCWPDLSPAVALARAGDVKVLVEPEVTGREIGVAVLAHPDGRVVAGPPLEIVLPQRRAFFDHLARYGDRDTVLRVPARLDPTLDELLRAQAVHAYRALDCRGQACVDFFADEDTAPVLHGVSTVPDLTARSPVPRIWAATGLSFTGLLTVLLDTALRR
ncbi:D-alanine--D-alanine ligase family protein [Actinoplanes sichuanensis]|uniref:D-alanine--D-alanine ligase n=1 Tax=Actinoplanes sichuanensis TaxID=512349 RepID=A0ABW4A3C4_9ACTN|nr:D-alanine--D-alanine ligase family protein [Actinoplanes sichuanensis]BEL05835.1 D-alanine--D-alanine ligase family protein [Actinoplanes sichuanensis]